MLGQQVIFHATDGEELVGFIVSESMGGGVTVTCFGKRGGTATFYNALPGSDVGTYTLVDSQ